MSVSTDWIQAIVWLVGVHQQIREADKRKLWDPHLPNVAASEALLQDAEKRLGHRLDPQYRRFLLHADGWRHFYQDVDLFGTSDLLDEARSAWVGEFLEELGAAGVESARLGNSVLMGVAADPADPTLFAMVRPGHAGAGQVYWYSNREVDVFPDFESFFVTMAEYTRREVGSLIRDNSR